MSNTLLIFLQFRFIIFLVIKKIFHNSLPQQNMEYVKCIFFILLTEYSKANTVYNSISVFAIHNFVSDNNV